MAVPLIQAPTISSPDPVQTPVSAGQVAANSGPVIQPIQTQLANSTGQALDDVIQDHKWDNAGYVDPQGNVHGGIAGITPDYTDTGINTTSKEPNRDTDLSKLLTYGIAGVPVGFADTVLQSTGFADDTSMQNWLKNSGATEFGDYYGRNKEVLRAIGDTAGMIIPGTLAVKAASLVRYLPAVTRLGSVLKDSTALRTIMSGAVDYTGEATAVRSAALYRQSIRGLFSGGDFSNKIAAAASGAEVSLPAARAAYVAQKTLDGAYKGVAFELGVAGTMNQSDTLYPDDYTTFDNLAWASVGPIVGAAAEFSAARWAARTAINRITQGVSPLVANDGIGQAVIDATFRPGERGVGLTLYGVQKSATKGAIEGSSDGNAISALNRDLTSLDTTIVSQIEAVGKDRNLVLDKQFAPSEDQLRILTGVLDDDPTTYLGVQKFDHLPGLEPDAFLESVDTRIKNLHEKANGLMAKGTADLKSMKEGFSFKAQAQQLEPMQFNVIENNGDITNFSKRGDRWLDHHSMNDIIKVRGVEGENAIYKITFDKTGVIQRDIGVDANFNVIVPKTADIQLEGSRLNIVERVGDSVDSETTSGQFAKIITDAYQPKAPAGRALLDSMSPQAAHVMKTWTAGGMETLRTIVEKGDPSGIAAEIYRAHQPLRDALKELSAAKDYGSIRLFRGESSATAKGGVPASDVASFSTKVGAARRFARLSGGKVIQKEVNIDDIIAVAGFDGELEFVVKNNKLRRYSTDDNAISSSIGWQSTNSEERSGAFAIASKVLDKWSPKKAQTMIAAPDLPWFNLEMIDHVLDKYPEAGNYVQWTDGIKNKDDLQFAILNKKSEEYATLMARGDKLSAVPAFSRFKMNDIQIADMLNLPRPIGGQVHPVMQLMANTALQGDKGFASALIPQVSDFAVASEAGVSKMERVQRAMQELATFPATPAFTGSKPLEVSGRMMKQTDAKPVLMMSKPVAQADHAPKAIINLSMYQRQQQLEMFQKAAGQGADIVDRVARTILPTGAYQQAKKVEDLTEGVAAGRGVLTAQDRVAEQIPTLNAMNAIIKASDDEAKIAFSNMIEPLKPALSDIYSSKNQVSLLNFNRIEHSYRYGWDIAGVNDRNINVSAQNVKNTFILRQTDQNKSLWAKVARENDWVEKEMPDPAYMPSMTRQDLKAYTPLAVDELASTVFQGVSQISRKVGTEGNFLRKGIGRGPMTLRDFHLPVPEFAKENTHVVLDDTGNLVNMYTGATSKESLSRASEAVKQYLKDNPGKKYSYHSWDSVKRYNNVFSDDFQKFINYADNINQTGISGKGGFFKPEVEVGPERLKLMVEQLSRDFNDVAVRTRALIFEPQLNYARQAHAASGFQSDKASGPSIWERYANMIYGGQTLTPRTNLGRLYYGAEQMFDATLSNLYDKHSALSDRSASTGPKSAPAMLFDRDQKAYETIRNQLGDYDPFGSTENYLRDTYKYATPPKLKTALAKANAISSTLMLRFLDVGTAIMNGGSLMATMAPVMRGLQKQALETEAEWKGRVAAWSSPVSSAQVNFSPVRASITATTWAFSKEASDVFKDAAKSGRFTPEFVAFHENLIEPTESNSAASVDKFLNAASYFADKSEMLSRKVAWGMGYKMAKDVFKLEDKENMYIFADKIAAEMIGDYRSVNRPQMFQGAMGLPLGLFQTYMFNYYRRLYGYVERKDYRTLATAYASQASIYGAQSVPGFQLYSDMFASNWDDTSNPVDNFNRTYGDNAVTDLILHGSLSSIPRFFGQGNLAFYKRGDANMSVPPTIFNMQNIPAFSMAKTAFDGIVKTADMFSSGGQFSKRELVEILANYGVNRPFKASMELLAGQQVDRNGQIIEQDTRDTLGMISRVLGTTKMTTAKLQETYQRQRVTDMSHSALKEKMRDSFRAQVRDGSLTADSMAGFAQDYLKGGGDPRYFAGWMRENAIVATHSKFEKKYNELLKSGKIEELSRFMAIMQPDLSPNGE